MPSFIQLIYHLMDIVGAFKRFPTLNLVVALKICKVSEEANRKLETKNDSLPSVV